MGTYYSYNCLSCGTREYMQSRVRRCNFCSITLCRRCKQDGVCPRCYSILLPAERGKLGSTSYLIENGCGCSIGTCFLVLFIGLAAGAFRYGVIGILGPAVFVLISIAVGFIAGGKAGKKKIVADILTRMNADLESLKQRILQNPDPDQPPSVFVPPADFNQPVSRIPATSYIPPPAESLDFQAPAGQPLHSTPSQDPFAESNPGTQICNACGARLFLVDEQIPAFCASCGNPVK